MDAPTPSPQFRQATTASSNNNATIIKQLRNQLAAQTLEAAVYAEENERLRDKLVAYEATFKAHTELFALLEDTPGTPIKIIIDVKRFPPAVPHSIINT